MSPGSTTSVPSVSVSPSQFRDLIGSSSPRLSSLVCMQVIRAIQDAAFEHKGAMVAGLAQAFLLVSELTGLSVSDLMTYARNAMTDGEVRYPEYRACEAFLVNEVFSPVRRNK